MLKTMVKRCLVCGAEFETTQRHAKYCLEHRRLSRSVRERQMQGQGMAPTICAQCGKPFYGHGNARFCSDICRRRNAAAKDVGTTAVRCVRKNSGSGTAWRMTLPAERSGSMREGRQPLCAHPARFLRENFPGVTLRLEGRRVVFHDPRQRPELAAYVQEAEPWIAEELAREKDAARRGGR